MNWSSPDKVLITEAARLEEWPVSPKDLVAVSVNLEFRRRLFDLRAWYPDSRSFVAGVC